MVINRTKEKNRDSYSGYPYKNDQIQAKKLTLIQRENNMKSIYKGRIITVTCLNSLTRLTAYLDENGEATAHCPTCGSVTKVKILGRRHVQQDTYAPKGQTLMY